MKNTTTEQKSIENTTTEQKSIENTTTKQKSIEKTAMKKITATTLLLFLALFSLTTCLIAQESGQQAGQTGQQARKQGWFVGVSPFSFIGAEIKTSRTTTTEVDVAVGSATFEYEATIDSDDSVSNFYNNTNGRSEQIITNAEAKQSLIRGAIELCKRSDAADATTGRIEDTVPLDPSDTLNTKFTVRYDIGYYGGNLTGVDKTTEICHLPASDTLPLVVLV